MYLSLIHCLRQYLINLTPAVCRLYCLIWQEITLLYWIILNMRVLMKKKITFSFVCLFKLLRATPLRSAVIGWLVGEIVFTIAVSVRWFPGNTSRSQSEAESRCVPEVVWRMHSATPEVRSRGAGEVLRQRALAIDRRFSGSCVSVTERDRDDWRRAHRVNGRLRHAITWPPT